MYSIQEYRFAESIEEALALVEKSPRNVVLGSGTWLRLGKKRIGTAIDLTRLGLDKVELQNGEITIGAAAPLRSFETDELLKGAFGGALTKCVSGVVGTQFRNMATVGANVYSRFGFSDLITALLALDAEVTLARSSRMKLSAFLANRPKRDILTHIHLKADGRIASYQTLRRTKTDFAILNLCLCRNADLTYVVSVGARPGVAKRCAEAEACLNAGDIEGAAEALSKMTFGTNMRASADYRRDMARILLRRAWEETEAMPL